MYQSNSEEPSFVTLQALILLSEKIRDPSVPYSVQKSKPISITALQYNITAIYWLNIQIHR